MFKLKTIKALQTIVACCVAVLGSHGNNRYDNSIQARVVSPWVLLHDGCMISRHQTTGIHFTRHIVKYSFLPDNGVYNKELSIVRRFTQTIVIIIQITAIIVNYGGARGTQQL